jgi:hypothetical protein
MKAIKIDVSQQAVYEVDVFGLESMQRQVGGLLETAMNIDTDCIYVNEEGLFGNNDKWFNFDGSHQPFAGHGLVVGTDDNGRTIAPKITVDEVKSKVRFLTLVK